MPLGPAGLLRSRTDLAWLLSWALVAHVSAAARCAGPACSAGQGSSAAGAGLDASALQKRGAGWGYQDTDTASDFAAGLNVAWWYNWASARSAGLGSDPASASNAAIQSEFVPMVWGNCCGLSDINSSIPTGAAELLGFNEPNHMEQSDLTAQQAAALWPAFEQAKKQRGGNLRLGSPAPAACGSGCLGDPIQWLVDFYSACNQMYGRDCETDFVATHMYTCNAQYLQWYLNDFVSLFKRPVWLTEFACDNQGGPLSNQVAFMRAGLAIMDAMPSVERYAWFSPHADAFQWLGGGQAGSPSLLTSDSPPQLTVLGRIYTGLASSSPSEGLPNDVAAALRMPLTQVSKTGSWAAVCANCTNGASALAGVAQQEQAAFRQHCLDCGFGEGGAFRPSRRSAGS